MPHEWVDHFAIQGYVDNVMTGHVLDVVSSHPDHGRFQIEPSLDRLPATSSRTVLRLAYIHNVHYDPALAAP